MWCFLLLLLGCRETLRPPQGGQASYAPAAWNRVLDRAVSPEGDVDYAMIAEERVVLDNYVRWISRPGADRGRSPGDAHAFWLNAFNTLTIYQIVHRDLNDVTEVPSILPWPGAGFYGGTDFVLDGEALSLWEIGHEKITYYYQEYRDFGALCVGARGGPPMRSELYTSENLAMQLDQQMGKFMMSEAGLHIDPDGALFFNPMFERYADELDIYTGHTSLCAIAAKHTKGRRRRRVLQAWTNGCDVAFLEMDWSLNGSPP